MKFLCQVDWKHGVSRGILLSLAATDAPLACSCPAVSPQGRRRGCGASITRVTKAPQYFESIAAHTSRKMVANPPCPFWSVLSAVPWHQASLPPGRVSPHARRMGPQYSHCTIFEKTPLSTFRLFRSFIYFHCSFLLCWYTTLLCL